MDVIFKILNQIFSPLIMPFRKIILQPLFALTKLPFTIARKSREYLQKILNPKEITLKSYLKIGRLYIAKRLILIVILVTIALVYVLFINPPAVLNRVLDRASVLVANTNKTTAFSGKAKIYDEDKTRVVYEGEMKEGVYSGFGKLFNKDKKLIFEGNFENGEKNGIGKEFSSDGKLIYSGGYENGERSGQGKLYNKKEKVIYKGEFKLGKKNGQGEEFDSKGKLVYKGEFTNGVYGKTGKKYFDSGVTEYEGEFQNGVYGGNGTLYYQDGTILYEGGFKNGLFAGDGKEFFLSGIPKYEGQFGTGLYNGNGTLFFESGKKKFEGNFQSGKFSGSGKLYNEDELLVYEGDFKEGLYHKVGTLFSDGEIVRYKGFFNNGDIFPEGFLSLTTKQLEAVIEKPDNAQLELNGQLPPLLDDEGTETKDGPLLPVGAYLLLTYDALQMEIKAEASEKNPNDTFITAIDMWNQQTVNDIYKSMKAKEELDKKEAKEKKTTPKIKVITNPSMHEYQIGNYLYQFTMDVNLKVPKQLKVMYKCKCQYNNVANLIK